MLEITEHTAHRLVLAKKNWLTKVIIWALFLAGISLTLASIKTYGMQSWYRLTYWLGGLMAVASLLSYTFKNRSSKSILDKETNKLTIYFTRGWINNQVLSFDLDKIQGLRIEKKGNPPKFRLSLQLDQDKWHPLQQVNQRQLNELEQVGKKIQAFLSSGQ